MIVTGAPTAPEAVDRLVIVGTVEDIAARTRSRLVHRKIVNRLYSTYL